MEVCRSLKVGGGREPIINMSLSYLNSFYCQWDCHVEYITHWVSYCIHYNHNEFVSFVSSYVK
jgi:hypothetical protein